MELDHRQYIGQLETHLSLLLQLKGEIAAIRMSRSLDRLSLLLRSYNPEQPRVPAGSSDGGRWAGYGSSRTSTPDTRIRLANYLTGSVNGATAAALGVTRIELGDAIHRIKDAAGLRGSDNVLIHIPSGDVFFGGENVGNVLDER